MVCREWSGNGVSGVNGPVAPPEDVKVSCVHDIIE